MEPGPEGYQPTEEDFQLGEDHMTERQKKASSEREKHQEVFEADSLSPETIEEIASMKLEKITPDQINNIGDKQSWKWRRGVKVEKMEELSGNVAGHEVSILLLQNNEGVLPEFRVRIDGKALDYSESEYFGMRYHYLWDMIKDENRQIGEIKRDLQENEDDFRKEEYQQSHDIMSKMPGMGYVEKYGKVPQ